MQYHIKLILEEASGNICHAECGCPAGLGPSGSCKHIAALGYALEEYARIACIRNQVACTSQLQTWNQPRKRVLEPSEVSSKLEHGKEKRPMTCKFYDPRPQQSSYTSTDEVSSFFAKLKATAPSC